MPKARSAPRPPVLCGLAVLAALLGARPGGAAEFSAGIYSFSDELGGFKLLSATGTGTADDPVVLVEEFDDVAASTLVIRNRALQSGDEMSAHVSLSLVKEIVNRSKRVWAGFELELQEQLRKPSVYGDGLSFKQFDALSGDVGSDAFLNNERLFEPYDIIEFSNGHVDPGAAARLWMTITDPTPVPEFYLVEDPKLLSAGLSPGGTDVARQ